MLIGLKRKLIAGLSVFVIVGCSAMAWLWVTSFNYEVASPASVYLHLLQNFQTYTVEVSFVEVDPPEDIFGLNKDQLSNQALEIVSSISKERFKNIRYSRFGQPYSFKTNPLNVAIEFHIAENTKHPERLEVTAYITRAYYFSAYMYRKETGKQLGTEKQLIEGYANPQRHGLVITDNSPIQVHNQSEVKAALESYAQDIVQAMRPDYEEAVAAEASMLSKLSHKQ